jgi:hypothetical protein
MVWVKNCQDDDWINLDNVFSISFQQMNKKEDWVEFFVRPSNARIFQVSLGIGPNPNPEPDSEDITWHSLFYDRATSVAISIFDAIAKAERENRIMVDLQNEIIMEFG